MITKAFNDYRDRSVVVVDENNIILNIVAKTLDLEVGPHLENITLKTNRCSLFQKSNLIFASSDDINDIKPLLHADFLNRTIGISNREGKFVIIGTQSLKYFNSYYVKKCFIFGDQYIITQYNIPRFEIIGLGNLIIELVGDFRETAILKLSSYRVRFRCSDELKAAISEHDCVCSFV